MASIQSRDRSALESVFECTNDLVGEFYTNTCGVCLYTISNGEARWLLTNTDVNIRASREWNCSGLITEQRLKNTAFLASLFLGDGGHCELHPRVVRVHQQSGSSITQRGARASID